MKEDFEFDVPERFRKEAVSAGNILDKCLGAVLSGKRVTCEGTVKREVKNNTVYRFGFCEACLSSMADERRAAKEARVAAAKESPTRARKLPGR